MEAAKNAVKSATGKESQFTPGNHANVQVLSLRTLTSQGHQVPIQDMDQPSQQKDMKGPDPANTQIPTEDGGYQTYKAAGKLEGKKAIITGGDSGIGRAIAILFAMEGADSFIAYLPAEEDDAKDTKEAVEKHGRQCHLMATDLTKKENCKKVVDAAVKKMSTVNILVNNAAYQNMTNGINELSEYVISRSGLYMSALLTLLS